jgi:N-acetylglucosamine kinase-like BadF-type ATPase
MKLFLGVDGGQSSTKALIGDETGRILGAGVGGPCNHAAAGEGRARLERGLSTSLAAACADAGLEAASVRFEAACFGMSGGPEDKREIVASVIASIIRIGHLIVTTDAAVALAGATETGQGIIVIAGTGSIALGRNAEGRVARAGGWGHLFGDEGGAFDMVRQALRAALRMEEGWGEPTSLRSALLEATASADANAALHRFYSDDWPRDRVAALASQVDAAAIQGDAVAIETLRRAAQELATLAAAVRDQLWKPGDEVEMAYSGGVFQSQSLAERFRALVEKESGNRCHPPLRTPAEGALLEAMRAG